MLGTAFAAEPGVANRGQQYGVGEHLATPRGRAIEPVVREALARLLPDDKTPWLDPANAAAIGGYWTRSNDVGIDVVAVDRAPVARRIGLIGSIKWLENAEFDHRDVVALIHCDEVGGERPCGNLCSPRSHRSLAVILT